MRFLPRGKPTIWSYTPPTGRISPTPCCGGRTAPPSRKRRRKIHGAVLPKTDEWDSFVITEEDHVELLSRVAGKAAIPSLFAAHVHDRSLLFVGFSLHDWNLRLVMRSLARYFARRLSAGEDDEIHSWSIDEQVSDLELKLWQKRGVYPYQLRIDEFVDKLRERMGP